MTVKKFHEEFQRYYFHLRDHQTWLREQADKAAKTDDIMTSSTYNGKADTATEILMNVKKLLSDFEVLVVEGKIIKEKQ